MDSSETDDQLIIVNRSETHRVSKKLLRKIPYFDRMLSHECLESKRSKVELDFDEKALKSILKWIELDSIMLKMNSIINLCSLADYFGIDENFIKDCINYFHAYFTSRDIPDIIPQVSPTSKLINSGILNAFICRHFKRIVKSSDWKRYPIEAVIYICKLDLLIDSEMQVFDAIISWVTCGTGSRKYHLRELLSSIRWCHLKDADLTKIKENEFFKSSGFMANSCSSGEAACYCSFNRTKQSYFIVIEKLEDANLRIRILDRNFSPLINQVIRLDKSITLHFLHEKYVTDIAFDSGSKMIRIDWKRNKYNFIDIEFPTFINQSHKKCSKKYSKTYYETCKLIDAYFIFGKYFDDFDLISLAKDKEKFIVDCFMHTSETHNWSLKIKSTKAHYNSAYPFQATILDNNIYILTKYCELIKFDYDKEKLKIIKIYEFKDGLKFSNLLLTSSPAYKDSVILVEKSSKEIFRFSFSTKRWRSIGRLINYSCAKTVTQKRPSKMVAFTSTFLSLDAIKPCLKRKHD